MVAPVADTNDLLANEDFKDLDEDGRASVRSTPISKTGGLRFESPPAFLAAGIAMVGAVRSCCIDFVSNHQMMG